MKNNLQDPSLNIVRQPFLGWLSRFCLLTALGNFICIVPLSFLSHYTDNTILLFKNYTIMLTAVGIILTVLGILSKYQHYEAWIARISISILFLQTCFIMYQVRSLEHPTIMFFPLLCFLTTPILGKNSSYLIAILSILAILLLDHFLMRDFFIQNKTPSFILIVIGILFSAYLSHILWRGVLIREEKLRLALKDLNKKAEETETWAKEIAKASTLLNEGALTLKLPETTSHLAFAEITKNMGEIQKKLGQHFGEMLVQDRLNSIGLLASGLAHELNTPLTTLSFMLSDINLTMKPDIKLELLDEIKQMGLITREFLNFASPQEKDAELDLNEIVKNSVSFLSRIQSEKTNIHLELNKDPVFINGIKNQIQQIILNLYKNAIDAVSKDRSFHFSIKTFNTNGGQAALTLEDNAQGIDSKVLSKIFDPFFTTKEPGKGFGLGLYIVHQIVKSHLGELKIESKLGTGTKITITFPQIEHLKKAS